MKKALVTGVTGQDGSYLTELLLSKGYEVHGLIRRSSSFNTSRLEHLYEDPHYENRRLHLHYADIADGSRISSLVGDIRPDEVYNLAAQSHVRVSFDEPVHTGETTGLATTKLLEAIKSSVPTARYYQASSSEMFGSEPAPQNEESAFSPQSPYAAAKLYSHWITRNYRESYGLYAVNGILFNHESPRRGKTFVTRKISQAVARIHAGHQKFLYLGNLEAKRDWGYAPDYVVGMWRLLQQNEPLDIVLGTGVSRSVKEFAESCFSHVGLNWENHVRFDSRYLRPSEVDELRADPRIAEEKIQWKNWVGHKRLAEEMVEQDIRSLTEPVVDRPIGDLWEMEAYQ